MILQLWMTARAYPPDEKIGPPPNAAVLSLFQMFFVRKTPSKNPIDRIFPPPFSRIFNGWQSLLAAVTLTAFDSRGSRPSGPLRRSMGKIHAGLGPLSQRAYPTDVFCFCGKHAFWDRFFLCSYKRLGRLVVESMFTCSRRPPIFDLPGCHARLDLPGCH